MQTMRNLWVRGFFIPEREREREILTFHYNSYFHFHFPVESTFTFQMKNILLNTNLTSPFLKWEKKVVHFSFILGLIIS